MTYMTSILWHNVKYFKPDEFEYPDNMSYELILKLDELREVAGIPIVITDDYRPYTDTTGDDNSAHRRGLAIDTRCASSVNRFKIIRSALECGFARIGIYDKHIHLDIDDSLPQNVIWVGKSQ